MGTAHGKHFSGKFAAAGVADILLAQLHERRPAHTCLLDDVAKTPPTEPTGVGHGIDRKAATQGVSIRGAAAIGGSPLR